MQKFGLVALIALVVGLSANLFAQTPPSSGGGGGGGSTSTDPVDIYVVQSQDLARDLGLRRVHRGSIYYWSQSIDWDFKGTQNYTNVIGKSAEDVLAQLAAFEYVIRLKNTNDAINVYAYGSDDNGNTLFYGGTQFKVGEKPKIQMYQQYLPILNNVKSAEIIPLNPDGTSGQPITMNVSSQGQLLWQPWLSGAPNGLLAVRFNDGTLVTYRLSKPVGQSPSPSEGMASLSVQGHYIFVGNDAPVIDIVEVWNRPTVYFECGKGYITFDVRGVVQLRDGSTMLERPSSMVLTDEDGNNAQVVKLFTDSPSDVPLPTGKYRVRSFEWNLFGQPGLLYTGPYGDGKG